MPRRDRKRCVSPRALHIIVLAGYYLDALLSTQCSQCTPEKPALRTAYASPPTESSERQTRRPETEEAPPKLALKSLYTLQLDI